MAITDRHRIGIFGVIIGLLTGALFAVLSTSTATFASDILAYPSWPAEISLQVDAVAHEVSLNAAEPSLAPAMAFRERAMRHELFSGDGFGLGRVDPRL